jgi:hypothetical protein
MWTARGNLLLLTSYRYCGVSCVPLVTKRVPRGITFLYVASPGKAWFETPEALLGEISKPVVNRIEIVLDVC